MKKTYFVGIVCLMTMFVMSACQGGQKSTEEETAPVDYAVLVKEELPSMEEFVNTVDVFQTGIQQGLSLNGIMEDGEKAIREMLEPKGFNVECSTGGQDIDFISATKNCEFNVKEEDFIYSYSITQGQTDSLVAAYYFKAMGDMYHKGEILLADTCIYDALVDQIKEIGYKAVDNPDDSSIEEQYVKEKPTTSKDCYYFLCNREEKRITLEYDFMKAQELEFNQ